MLKGGLPRRPATTTSDGLMADMWPKPRWKGEEEELRDRIGITGKKFNNV